MKIAEENIDLKEALKRWDNNDTVWTIEKGGIGPGYEQVIQIGIFELCKDLIGIELPKDNVDKWFDEALFKTMKREKRLDEITGAQAGAMKNIAFHFLKNGYSETLKLGKEQKANLIMVQNKFV